MRRPPFPSPPALLVVAALAAPLALAPTASGAESPLDEYQRTGTIDPCNPGIYAGGVAPNDVQQYAPDYLQALQDARRRGCARGGGGGSTATAAVLPTSGRPPSGPSGTASGTPYVSQPPAPPKVIPGGGRRLAITAHLPLAAQADGGTPAPILALAVMLLLVLAGGALAATGRYFGWRAGLLDPVRHAGGEAALRAGSAAGSLADRARALGRRRG